MNIIFLDIDGVLNSMPYFQSLCKTSDKKHQEISEYHLQMLSEIYHTCNCKIVLSSTWRELDDMDDDIAHNMYQYLINSLAKYNMQIISKTPVIHMNRPLEIKTWLNQQSDKNKIHFISLDDDFSEKDYEAYGIKDCLIHTEFFCNNIRDGGLQPHHVKNAISKFHNSNKTT